MSVQHDLLVMRRLYLVTGGIATVVLLLLVHIAGRAFELVPTVGAAYGVATYVQANRAFVQDKLFGPILDEVVDVAEIVGTVQGRLAAYQTHLWNFGTAALRLTWDVSRPAANGLATFVTQIPLLGSCVPAQLFALAARLLWAVIDLAAYVLAMFPMDAPEELLRGGETFLWDPQRLGRVAAWLTDIYRMLVLFAEELLPPLASILRQGFGTLSQKLVALLRDLRRGVVLVREAVDFMGSDGTPPGAAGFEALATMQCAASEVFAEVLARAMPLVEYLPEVLESAEHTASCIAGVFTQTFGAAAATQGLADAERVGRKLASAALFAAALETPGCESWVYCPTPAVLPAANWTALPVELPCNSDGQQWWQDVWSGCSDISLAHLAEIATEGLDIDAPPPPQLGKIPTPAPLNIDALFGDLERQQLDAVLDTFQSAEGVAEHLSVPDVGGFPSFDFSPPGINLGFGGLSIEPIVKKLIAPVMRDAVSPAASTLLNAVARPLLKNAWSSLDAVVQETFADAINSLIEKVDLFVEKATNDFAEFSKDASEQAYSHVATYVSHPIRACFNVDPPAAPTLHDNTYGCGAGVPSLAEAFTPDRWASVVASEREVAVNTSVDFAGSINWIGGASADIHLLVNIAEAVARAPVGELDLSGIVPEAGGPLCPGICIIAPTHASCTVDNGCPPTGNRGFVVDGPFFGAESGTAPSTGTPPPLRPGIESFVFKLLPNWVSGPAKCIADPTDPYRCCEDPWDSFECCGGVFPCIPNFYSTDYEMKISRAYRIVHTADCSAVSTFADAVYRIYQIGQYALLGPQDVAGITDAEWEGVDIRTEFVCLFFVHAVHSLHLLMLVVFGGGALLLVTGWMLRVLATEQVLHEVRRLDVLAERAASMAYAKRLE